ncbi:alpha/beta hydrolase [Amaricoccus tamworthensis]|uniref:alpha/beta hydrolase n=1 Tax=Amaricoccus tamworthensis TaxID=57002 RepID=UPI003C79FAA6
MSGLDASAAAHLARMAEVGLPPLTDLSAVEARRRFAEGYAADQSPHVAVAARFEITVGEVQVMGWRGIGAPSSGAPALMYLHGGGWLFGSPESHEGICRQIANLAKAVVIAPDYGLSPEAPFPAGLNDCAAVLRHIAGAAREFGVDQQRIAVGGDSAGGNLAAVLALMARDGDVPPLAAQLLIYPNTDQGQTADSFRRYGHGFGLSAAEMAWFRDHYLHGPEQFDDWRASPLRAKSLDEVAPAAVVLAGHDILHDEGAAYAARLERESRAVTRTWPGQIHGFVSMDRRIPEASEALKWLCSAWAWLEAADQAD